MKAISWHLWETDTFDREFPTSLRSQGEDVFTGLYELWRLVVTEALSDRGQKTFSSFFLDCEVAQTTVQVSIPVQAIGNAELLKLRGWLECHGEDGSMEPSPTGYAARARLLARIAAAHLRYLVAGSRWGVGGGDLQLEAKQVLDDIAWAHTASELP